MTNTEALLAEYVRMARTADPTLRIYPYDIINGPLSRRQTTPAVRVAVYLGDVRIVESMAATAEDAAGNLLDEIKVPRPVAP